VVSVELTFDDGLQVTIRGAVEQLPEITACALRLLHFSRT
jgi:hypothetical protein